LKIATTVLHCNGDSVNCSMAYHIGIISFAGHRETTSNGRHLLDIIWSLSRWSTSGQAVITTSREGNES